MVVLHALKLNLKQGLKSPNDLAVFDQIALTFDHIYRPNRYDDVGSMLSDNITYHNQDLTGDAVKFSDDELDRIQHYLHDPLVGLFAFLGLPHENLDDNKMSFANVWRNFFGQYKGKSKFIAPFVAPFRFMFSLLASAYRFSINMLKIITEFIPATLSILSFNGMQAAFNLVRNMRSGNTNNIFIGLLAIVPLLASAAAFLLTTILHFIGRAITSPMDGVKESFKLGKRLNFPTLGGFLGIVSLCTTILAYIAMPHLIKLALPSISAFAAAYMPHLAHSIQSVGNALIPAMNKLGGAFYKVLRYLSAMTKVIPFLPSAGVQPVITEENVMAGLVFTSLSIPVVLGGVKFLVGKIGDYVFAPDVGGLTFTGMRREIHEALYSFPSTSPSSSAKMNQTMDHNKSTQPQSSSFLSDSTSSSSKLGSPVVSPNSLRRGQLSNNPFGLGVVLSSTAPLPPSSTITMGPSLSPSSSGSQ